MRSDFDAIKKIYPYLLLIVIYILLTFLINPAFLNDDAFFHFAISKLTLEHGLLKSLPQADNLTWKTVFVDKEFFFHVLTTLSYYIGNESGIKILTKIINTLSILLIFHFCRNLSKNTLLGLLCMALCFTQIPFFWRLMLIRPHSLSIFLYCLSLYGILNRNIWCLIIACLLHPLSYHVLYLIPINLFLALLIIKDFKKQFALGLIAFTIGCLIHPYFPKNFEIFWSQLKISLLLAQNVSSINIPQEFKTPSFFKIWSIHLVFLATLPFVVLWVKNRLLRPKLSKQYHKLTPHNLSKKLTQKHKKKLTKKMLRSQEKELQKKSAAEKRDSAFRTNLFLLALTALYYILIFKNYRSLEYAYPLIIVLWGHLYHNLPHLKKYIVVTLILLSSCNLVDIAINDYKTDRSAFYQGRIDAVKVLPEGSKNKKVYNCVWDVGSIILHQRPYYKFVDLLDPYFLEKNNPNLAKTKEDLSYGNFIDPYRIIKEQFSADYVVCNRGNLNYQMDLDPRFMRLHPDKITYMPINHQQGFVISKELSTYQLLPKYDEVFIKNFLLSDLGLEGPEQYESTIKKSPTFTNIPDSNSYLRIAKLNLSKINDRKKCAMIRVTKDEMIKKSGPKFLGVGGDTPNYIFLNGKPIKFPRQAGGNFGMIHLFTMLEKKLRPSDIIDIVICPTRPNNEFVLSLWPEEDIKSHCLNKQETFQVDYREPLNRRAYRNASFNFCQLFQF